MDQRMLAQKKQGNLNAYKNTEISTANQKKLILMLYDGVLRFLRIAKESMEPKSYDVVNSHIIKSQDIVTELMLALDMRAGKEIASNLFNIYAYVKKRLLEANIAKDAAPIDEVIHILGQLREAWAQAADEIELSAQKQDKLDQGLSVSIRG